MSLESKFFGNNSVLAIAIYVLNRFSVNWAKNKNCHCYSRSIFYQNFQVVAERAQIFLGAY
jgi:hypothetical protein